MKNLTSVLLLFCLLSSLTTASFAEIFMPLKVGGTMIMIPIGPIQESEESSKTPLGDDEDNDGVRDDVQQNIVAKYGTNTPIANQSLDIARKYQKILSGNLTAKQINQQIADAEYLNACIQNTTGTNTDGLGYVVPLQLNTVERTRAYLTAARDAYHQAGPPNYRGCGNSAANKSQLAKAANTINAPDLSDYDVYFINGVRTSEDEAETMKRKLQTLLNKDPVELLWNENDTLVQFFDLYVEKIGEVNVDKTDVPDFWNFIMVGTVSPPSALWWAIQRWMEPDRDVGYWSEQDLEDMIERIKGSLENNRKTLVVSHSQGNFFYRNIWQAIDQWDTDKTEQCFVGVGFAPPLSSKPGNFDYITNSNDSIINNVRKLWPNVLKSNVTVPKDFNGDKLGHGMLKTYINHSASLSGFETELKQAVKQIDKSCTSSNCAEPVGESGGQGEHQYTYVLKDTSAHKVEISFEAYSVPDEIRITANGKTIAETNGLVSGFHQWEVDYDPKVHGTEFVAHVDAPEEGTQWNLCIDCEGSDCGSQIERKQVSYSIHGAGPAYFPEYVCANHRIDGQLVQSSIVQLSKGQHMFTADCWCNEEIHSFCSVFHNGGPRLSLSGASCGSQEECSLYTKKYVMFEVD